MLLLRIVDRLQKYSILIVATCFFFFTLKRCVEKFFDYQTASSPTIVKSKDFGLPEVTVCMTPVLDPRFSSALGYQTDMSYILGPWQGQPSNLSLPPDDIFDSIMAVKRFEDIFDSITVSLYEGDRVRSSRVMVTESEIKVDLSVGQGRCFSLRYPPEAEGRYVTTLVFERWEREGRLGSQVEFFVGHKGQVFTRQLDSIKVPLNSRSYIYQARPTGQVLLEEDPQVDCLEAMNDGFDACWVAEYGRLMHNASGCVPPWAFSGHPICLANQWKNFVDKTDEMDSLFKSHRFRVCPRPCTTMKANFELKATIPGTKHCERCGTFKGNPEVLKKVPYGANVTRVIITLEEEFMVDRAFFAYSFLELVAEIGGYLGLFLGPNLLTVGSLISFLIGKLNVQMNPSKVASTGIRDVMTIKLSS